MEDHLIELLPEFRRIRDNRIYCANGRRILDLYMDDGRAIFSDSRMNVSVKNAMDKGQLRAYPGQYKKRFLNSLSFLFPEWPAVKIFESRSNIEKAIQKLAIPHDAIAELRPFMSIPKDSSLAVLTIPGLKQLAPSLLLSKEEKALEGIDEDIIPPGVYLYACRSIKEWIRLKNDGGLPGIWQRWDRLMGDFFKRDGAWLWPDKELVDRFGSYPAFFKACLDAGILVSPDEKRPSVITFDFDPGELGPARKVFTLCSEHP